MDPKRLLILGGGRYNVPSIRAARNAGFIAIVADRNPDAPGFKAADHALAIDLNDCDALIQAVMKLGGIDGIVSMAEAGVRPAAALSARLGLPSISEEAAANATSKAAMRHLWSERRFSTEFEVASSSDQAKAAALKLGFPLIFKPDRSLGGSRGVTRVKELEEVSSAFEAARSGGLPDSDVVIERCIEGTEHSAEVLIWQGKTSVLCIGQKIKSSFPYRVDVSVQYPAPLDPSQESNVGKMCYQAVTALGLTQGVAHIEFAYTGHGPVLFELGARCGGGHTPQIAHHVSGVDEFVEACRMACGMPPAQFTPVERRGADYRFLVFAPGVVQNVTVPGELLSDGRVLDVGATIQRGDTIRSLQTTSERAGFVVTTGDTLGEATERADRACRQISVQYSDGTVRRASELSEFQVFTHS